MKVDEDKLLKIVQAIFTTHGFDAQTIDGWVMPTGVEPAIKAFWYPEASERVGQLTIEIFINESRTVIESFAGYGEKKFESALENFIKNALPLYLAAFWGYDAKEVAIKRWSIEGEDYLAFIGDYGVINASENFSIPKAYLERIYKVISKEELGADFHWFNFFYVNFNERRQEAEALKDNEAWDVGKQSLLALDWQKSKEYYSVRQSIILKKE